ncbi:hypothetical protein [Micropruina sp.]|uniref:hypothetical protein n=1 Tax=Micropruina sp. TaxID=2737536 RepID=UPI002604A084|nr:hypothetical protein [Micropruina sp.]
MIGRNAPRTGGSWARTSVIIAAAVTAALAGCAKTPPVLDPPPTAVPAPSSAEPSPSGSASATPSESSSPSTTPSSSPSSTPSDKPAVKATGSLALYSEASKKLAGTCATKSGVPTLTVADRANDFFGTIDATMVLSARRTTVSKLTIALGEDSESIVRTISYNAAQPTKGTSLELTGKGATFTAKGKLSNTENGRPAGTIPVTLTITCASTNW